MKRSSLLGQQLRYRIHAIGSMHIPGRLVIDHPKPIHSPRIIGPRPRSLWNRLQRLQASLGSLPWRQLHLVLRRLCQSAHRVTQHNRAAHRSRATPKPPPMTDCRSQAHVSLQKTADTPSLRDRTPRESVKRTFGTPPDTPTPDPLQIPKSLTHSYFLL